MLQRMEQDPHMSELGEEEGNPSSNENYSNILYMCCGNFQAKIQTKQCYRPRHIWIVFDQLINHDHEVWECF